VEAVVHLRFWVLAAVVAHAAGCIFVPYLAFTQTHPPMPARDPTCQLGFLSAPPAVSYTELGVFERGIIAVYSAEDFKTAVQTAACAAGADAVIAEIDRKGIYVRGTAIKLSEAPRP
jgi:hypothetical protein